MSRQQALQPRSSPGIIKRTIQISSDNSDDHHHRLLDNISASSRHGDGSIRSSGSSKGVVGMLPQPLSSSASTSSSSSPIGRKKKKNTTKTTTTSTTKKKKKKKHNLSLLASIIIKSNNNMSTVRTAFSIFATILLLGWTFNMIHLIRWTFGSEEISNKHHFLGNAAPERLLERILYFAKNNNNNNNNNNNSSSSSSSTRNGGNETHHSSHFSLSFWKRKEAPFMSALERLRREFQVPTMHPTESTGSEQPAQEEEEPFKPEMELFPKHKGTVPKSSEEGTSEWNDIPYAKVYIPPHRTIPKGEMKHIVLDGIQRSPYLDWTDDPDDEDAVWVIDLDQVDCYVLYHEIESALERRERRYRLQQPGQERTVVIRSKQDVVIPDRTNGVEIDPSPLQQYGFTLMILDFFDYGSMYFGDDSFCVRAIVPLLGKENIRLATRQFRNHRNISHVGRKDTDLFFDQGRVDQVTDNYWASYYHYGARKALRYGVRTDLCIVLNQVLVKYYSNHSEAEKVDTETISIEDSAWNDTERMEQAASKIDIITLPRSMDVVHFWKTGEDTEYGSHRDAVNEALQRIPAKRPGQSLTIFTDTLGSRDKSGRNSAQVEYAWALLQCKIFIACQRDRWEDHYRLMEGMISGALVMTDPMHPLPLYLENGTSLVVFESLAQLQDLVLYYLDHPQERMDIARRGREIALKYHRSWHIMERIILGNWTSPYF